MLSPSQYLVMPLSFDRQPDDGLSVGTAVISSSFVVPHFFNKTASDTGSSEIAYNNSILFYASYGLSHDQKSVIVVEKESSASGLLLIGEHAGHTCTCPYIHQ
jgi:hypothetical protein